MKRIVAATLFDLHRLTFFKSAPIPAFEWGHWWLAFAVTAPVAFAGLVPSTHAENAGYFCRVGVLQESKSLRLRLTRAAEGRARNNGSAVIYPDTTDNVASANNIIRAGYRLLPAALSLGMTAHLYWRKSVGGGSRR